MKTIPEETPVAFMRVPLTDAEDLDRETMLYIDQARSIHKLPPLQRCEEMDALARRHAKHMAQHEVVEHSVSSVEDLQSLLNCQQVGENIHRGKTVCDMHAEIMSNTRSINRINMMSAKFDQVGTGTILGEDGLLYSVQLFRKHNGAPKPS